MFTSIQYQLSFYFIIIDVHLLFVALLVSKLATKVADILNSAHEEHGNQTTDDDEPLLSHVISSNGMAQYNKTLLIVCHQSRKFNKCACTCTCLIFRHVTDFLYLRIAFELSCGRVVTRVYVTTTGDKVYGFLPREHDKGKYVI